MFFLKAIISTLWKLISTSPKLQPPALILTYYKKFTLIKILYLKCRLSWSSCKLILLLKYEFYNISVNIKLIRIPNWWPVMKLTRWLWVWKSPWSHLALFCDSLTSSRTWISGFTQIICHSGSFNILGKYREILQELLITRYPPTLTCASRSS